VKILLDTNIIIYALYRPNELSPHAVEYLNDISNSFFYSILSLWEIELKHMKHPKEMTVSALDVETLCKQSGMRKIELRSEHIQALNKLSLPTNVPRHKDPFDRMLLCQAVAEKLTFVTHDSKIPNYGLSCIEYV